MSTYQFEKNEFIKLKSIEFFRNFIRNHNDKITDDDAFNPLRDAVAWTDVVRHFKAAFSGDELRALHADILLETLYPAEADATGHDTGASKKYLRQHLTGFFQETWNSLSHDKMRSIILNLLDTPAATVREKDIFEHRLEELQATLLLSEMERDTLLVLYFINDNFLALPEACPRSIAPRRKINFIAQCLDHGIHEVRHILSPDAKLQRYGCIDRDFDFNSVLHGFLVGADNNPLASHFYAKHDGETLPWDFYGELAEKHGALLKRLVLARAPERGLNILLHGEPGTGKTSFARSLARELNMECHEIAQGKTDRDGGHVSHTAFRFGALQLCASRIRAGRGIIIVDEADDMLRRAGSGGLLGIFSDSAQSGAGDKGRLNAVLDTIKATVVWITNTPSGELDESNRRRFDYSIRFDKLNDVQRLAIWKNNVRKHKLENLFDDIALEKFAGDYETSAGGVSLVLQNIAALAPEKNEAPVLVEKLIVPHCELLDIKSANTALLPAKDYTLDGLNIKSAVKLDRIIAAFRRFQSEPAPASPDRPRMNVLLSGPPGTGKTEFVKHLGKTLDTKIVVRMGSDLLSKWVGGTEQNIAAAFREAGAGKYILFLDEIDGLLQNRERSNRSWEVTQVNELLQQMENFGGILVAATNFSQNLDPAAIRRFTFKLEFDYLDSPGKELFFERMFSSPLTAGEAARLEAIPNLAPGDFRTARQGLYYLGGDITNNDRLAALETESNAKKQTGSAARRIGFGTVGSRS
ncbi:ATP-binding protein [Termitidicoccus mucosus]|uniref:AAA+ ATPase domain-containing protein n=1 Tax=Termitidicoccus mucosus TaxID=1184151 RepID=A0A178IB19_9BACT|nr:hypothetical protein AW736_24805 [Opitutaceae bacterium TSB47]